jgi:hypothetical protein
VTQPPLLPIEDEHNRAYFAALRVALLGLPALIIVFTFSIAVARFDARKHLVIEESNAIGPTYLRARIPAEPQQTKVEGLLRASARYQSLKVSADHRGAPCS